MPNKNKIVELLDELSPEAQLIGAVNTVLNDNGKLIGYNTDGYGFMQSVRDAGHDITGKNITVMGVGGASMAICAQSALDGAASVHIFARRTSRYWNRTQKFAENLSAKTGCQVCLARFHFTELSADQCNLCRHGSGYRRYHHQRYISVPS